MEGLQPRTLLLAIACLAARGGTRGGRGRARWRRHRGPGRRRCPSPRRLRIPRRPPRPRPSPRLRPSPRSPRSRATRVRRAAAKLPDTAPTAPEADVDAGSSLPSTGFEALLLALGGLRAADPGHRGAPREPRRAVGARGRVRPFRPLLLGGWAGCRPGRHGGSALPTRWPWPSAWPPGWGCRASPARSSPAAGSRTSRRRGASWRPASATTRSSCPAPPLPAS